MLVAHNAAPKYTIICLFSSTVHDLCLVPLVHSLGGVLTCAHAHIRLRYYSWTHVVEHDLPFGISSPFFVEGGSIDSTVYLRGSSAAHEVGVLNLNSSHVCGILPSVLSICILSSLHHRAESSLGASGGSAILIKNLLSIGVARHSLVEAEACLAHYALRITVLLKDLHLSDLATVLVNRWISVESGSLWSWHGNSVVSRVGQMPLLSRIANGYHILLGLVSYRYIVISGVFLTTIHLVISGVFDLSVGCRHLIRWPPVCD